MKKWLINVQKTIMDEKLLCKRAYENWMDFQRVLPAEPALMAEFEISREILRTSNWVRAQESAVLTESSISSGSSRGWVERNSLHRCEKRGIQKYSVRCQSS